MFNFIGIYSFIHVSGCVGRGPNALLYPWAYNVAKTAMYIYAIINNYLNYLFCEPVTDIDDCWLLRSFPPPMYPILQD